MAKIPQPIRFRIVIYDVEDGNSRTVTLVQEGKETLDDIKRKVQECFSEQDKKR